MILHSSLTEKTDYIKKYNLGGAMLWSVETDDFRGECGGKYPLLKTLNAGLRGGIPVPIEPTAVPKPTENPQPPITEPRSTPPPSGVCKQEGYVRDQQDCSKFYYCQNTDGKWNLASFSCSNGLVFDPAIKACNYKEQVTGC